MNEVFFGNLWHFSKKSENHNIGMVWSENWKKEHSHVVVAVCNCEDDCDELLTPQRSVRRREIKSHSRTPLCCQCSVKLPPKKLVALYGAISPKIYHAEEKSQMTHNNFILFSLKNFFFADFRYFPSPEMASRFLV